MSDTSQLAFGDFEKYLEDYEQICKLGTGGFSTVKKVENKENGLEFTAKHIETQNVEGKNRGK